ncbi:MAG: AAA family ATPase, partial [Erysipelotrichaceae bacterium]|nr:AAA family ATPase [Erysipelotrichaceae bacterium]
MERKYLNNLIEWMNDEDRKPLLVLGARQVGKSYLIEDLFAKKYFNNKYLRIDCSDDHAFVDYVVNNDSLQSVLDYIQIRYDFVPDSDHLLIIDEAQECLPIIKMMKHFCEKR